ncbi:hypothetical protein D3C87_1395800 [compost metagenome]
MQHLVGDARPPIEHRDDHGAFTTPVHFNLGAAGEFEGVIYEVRQDSSQCMWLCRRCAAHHAGNCYGFSGILIVVGDAVDERGQIDTGGFLAIAVSAACVSDPILHQAFDFTQVTDQLFLFRRIVCHVGPQPHPGDGRLQVV